MVDTCARLPLTLSSSGPWREWLFCLFCKASVFPLGKLSLISTAQLVLLRKKSDMTAAQEQREVVLDGKRKGH